MYETSESPGEQMATDSAALDGADEPTVESYLTPAADFLLIVTITILVSVAAVALMIP
ncbi:hypothetical protein AArcSl_2023 [Halalkaliarchaeum desulfuricum]|uniref:Uncharacterized protein n=1 Tax=Halalkaliarchaeum desulfuricum TaxID=2055893 RepID=A0A343TKM6_9EURY|nr:hypothetical protein AArcSl_2023 [Halalkaliarchaeum desulfuricum]